MNASFRAAIESLATRWPVPLGGRDAIQLGAYVRGWGLVDADVDRVVRELQDAFPGPSGADAFTRATLQHGGGPAAFDAVLRELREIVSRPPTDPTAAQPLEGHGSYFDRVQTALSERRFGMVLGEASLPWLVANFQGYLDALHATSPARWSEELSAMAAFEAWLGEKYAQPGAAWWVLMRVYRGVGHDALVTLAEAWAAHRRPPSQSDPIP